MQFERAEPALVSGSGIGGYAARGVLAPVDQEISATDLPVTGALPPELDGLYLRNSFNAHPAHSGPSGHLFLEGGMIHGVRLENGRARWYRNRWVVTDALASATGRPPPGGPVDRRWTAVNLANISVIAHAGRVLALGETGLPYELSAELETIGRYDFDGGLARSMTAHPKRDPDTGDLHFFGYWPRRPYVTYFCADRFGRIIRSEAIDVAGATIMHDFAITQRFAVFIDQPLLFERPPRPGGGLPFRWAPEYGSRLGVLDLHRTGAPVRWFEIDTCFIPHVMNAFDDGNEVVLRAAVSSPYYMTDSPAPEEVSLSLHEWRVDLLTGRVSDTCIADVPGEFPRIDERRVGRTHRYGYATEILMDCDWRACGGLFKYDFERGSVMRYDVGADAAASEAVFVPARPGAGEDEGWVLCYVYDARTDRSSLIIIDAQRFAGEPVASIALPQRVPYGAHGTWVARDALDRKEGACR
ncbi:carotenoid oxygenase family protein [Trinickia sp. LjRoot230]|uniref:carotenoid oxygenase family protein n=1 Tax=Trinickia sp. LjRoot230 TaxID=3342288 RepID=UPI003ECECEDF